MKTKRVFFTSTIFAGDYWLDNDEDIDVTWTFDIYRGDGISPDDSDSVELVDTDCEQVNEFLRSNPKSLPDWLVNAQRDAFETEED